MANLLTPQAPTDRVGRYPKHNWRVNSLPFTLQPVSIARVLPGETLKNLYMEARAVTSPVVSPIIGWKAEYYWFYVKVTDLMNDAIKLMFVDPNNAEITVGVEAANSSPWYTAKGGVNWLKLATKRVCETYFRDDGETMEDYALPSGIPIVQHRQENFLDSLTDKDLMPVGDDVADATTIADLERLLDLYEQLRALNLSDMTYEDWLRTNGIAIPNKDENKPELLVRFSDFQYPSNHISTDPTTMGTPTSAVSFVFRNSNRDPKFFKEPGFIVGYSVLRPKIYFGGLAGSAAGFAKRAWDWMPNYLRGMPETSIKNFGIDTGPLGDRVTNADGYWLDMRDELLYGDQFQNVMAFADAAGQAANHILALPAGTDIKWKYPTEAMIKGFFGAPATGNMQQDGFASFNIRGHEIDYTKSMTVAEV